MGVILNETSTIFSSEDSIERNKKEEIYLDYINNHISNVKIAFERYFLPIKDNEALFKDIMSTLVEKYPEEYSTYSFKLFCDLLVDEIYNNDIPDHDKSKYSEEEFDGYRLKYYPTEAEKADEELSKLADIKAEEAWEHHYKTNCHHPEHYYLFESKEARTMPLRYIIEMICDWSSFYLDKVRKDIDDNGISTVIEWYNSDLSKDERARMSEETIFTTEVLLNKVIAPNV